MDDWVRKVTTVSTFPPPGTFSKKAEEIAEIMAKPEVSPLGLKSAIKMVNYFINRGGKRLRKDRVVELRRAITLLGEMIQPEWTNPPKHCDRCKIELQGVFNVIRKKSDKQLTIRCDACIPLKDVSEIVHYEN